MIAGALIGAAGFALLARLDAATHFVAMLAPFTLIPFGMGFAVPAMTTLVLSSVERSSSGTATGALNAGRQVGGTLGVALFGAFVAQEHMVAGLHEAAWISAALMIAAAVVAASRRRSNARSEDRSAERDGHLPRNMQPQRAPVR
jgi:DHA2 family methylenomycin A resistance protein-like MFS transporter